WHDFRFTIEPKRKAWDLNPHGGEAARFSKPARRAVSGYLPYSVDPPRIELGFPPRQVGVVPLDTEPISFSGPAGDSNPDLLVAGQASSVGRAAHVQLEVRLGIEPSLPLYQS